MAKRHFIDGEGYMEYGTKQLEVNGQLENQTGWFFLPTPGGKPGASSGPKFIGRNKDEVKINRPGLAKRMENLDRGWKP